MVFDTAGVEIVDDPKVLADFLVLPPGHYTMDISGVEPVYAGYAGIELRGNLSLTMPKQQYGFDTWEPEDDDAGEEEIEYESVDVGLLGLPEESDWVLNGTYVDKTLIRNPLAYELSRRMGHYASRFEWVEVVLNENGGELDPYADYLGVYALLEKIKRGGDRVDVSKLGADDNALPKISGGYILKVDWIDPGDYVFTTDSGTQYILDYPKAEDATDPQKAWIEDYVNAFEASLLEDEPEVPYESLIDVGSFVDYFLLNELFKNVDGFRASMFMHKKRNGKLFMGPVWDFDIAAGNCRYYDAWDTAGWMLEEPLPEHQRKPPEWWFALFNDTGFRELLEERWFELREGVLADSNIQELIDELVSDIGPAVESNFERWPILGTYVPPNYFVAATYEQEIDFLKNWLEARAVWMDGELLP